jgi:hypothetical protein
LYYTLPSLSKRAKNFFRQRAAPICWWDRRFACHRRLEPALSVGQAILPAAAFQAALDCGYAA